MAHILAIDDEPAIVETLARVLRRDGHDVAGVTDPLAVTSLRLDRFDLIVCDVMMPRMDGFELVRRIRPCVDCPILFLTAKVAEEDAVIGLGLGADDYVRKPFGNAELRAKVAAHLRRERRERTSTLSFGTVRFNLGAKELPVDGERCALTPSEYAICEFLAHRRGQVFSRAQIREAVFGWDSESDDATVSAHVSNARAKLRRAGAQPIETVWGVGYKWQA